MTYANRECPDQATYAYSHADHCLLSSFRRNAFRLQYSMIRIFNKRIADVLIGL